MQPRVGFYRNKRSRMRLDYHRNTQTVYTMCITIIIHMHVRTIKLGDVKHATTESSTQIKITLYSHKPVIHTQTHHQSSCDTTHNSLTSSFDGCRVAAGFLEVGGGGALRLGPFFLSRVPPPPPPWLGEGAAVLEGSSSSFLRGIGRGLENSNWVSI